MKNGYRFVSQSGTLEYLYKVASGQICRSRDQLGSPAGVPVRQMAGPNPLKGPNNIVEV